MGRIYLTVGAGDGNTRGDGIGRGGVFDMGRGGELATSCISCCSCVVKAARVVLMLFSETFCLSVSRDGVIGTLRHWLCLGGCPRAMTSGEQIFWRADFLESWVWQERATYWVAVHWDSPRLYF